MANHRNPKITQEMLQSHTEQTGKYLLIEVVETNTGHKTYDSPAFDEVSKPPVGMRAIVKGTRFLEGDAERMYNVVFPFKSFETNDLEASGKVFSDGLARVLYAGQVKVVGRHNGWN